MFYPESSNEEERFAYIIKNDTKSLLRLFE